MFTLLVGRVNTVHECSMEHSRFTIPFSFIGREKVALVFSASYIVVNIIQCHLSRHLTYHLKG